MPLLRLFKIVLYGPTYATVTTATRVKNAFSGYLRCITKFAMKWPFDFFTTELLCEECDGDHVSHSSRNRSFVIHQQH